MMPLQESRVVTAEGEENEKNQTVCQWETYTQLLFPVNQTRCKLNFSTTVE